ncbi:MAG: RNA 2',3'-cyclic phosphodiesterase [Candidatus Methanomethylicaceae archaeon]
METVRAFLAFEVSEGVKSRIMEFEDELKECGADIKLVERENLHVTMKFLGEVGKEVLESIYGIMDSLSGGKFEIRVEGVGAFPNLRVLRVLWVGITEGADRVIDIQRYLDDQLVKLGFRKERDFVPHITVGRVKTPRNKENVIRVLEKYRRHYFGTSTVGSLLLKKSVLTPRGPVYSNLKEVELR